MGRSMEKKHENEDPLDQFYKLELTAAILIVSKPRGI